LHTRIYILGLAALLALTTSCSTNRDKWLNRNWHSMNTRYNGYYYGDMAIDEAFVELAKTNKDNYNAVIQVYRYGDKNSAQAVNPLTDRVLVKGTNMIKKHSMLINGKQKNKWIDDCYLFMGKANFIKREYSSALQQFYYVMQTSEKESTKEEARLWMIKTYQDMGEFSQAESEFNNVVPAKLSKKDGMREYHGTMADYFIKSEDYTPAIIPLQELLKVTKKKSRRARYTYILGQIYREMGDKELARQMFAEAVRLKPEFELEFQAAIALALSGDGSDSEDLRKKLRRLLRDDNNIDFQDQIYYALAILDEKEKNVDKAVSNYKKSVATSTSNREQKGLSYLALAEIYFGDRNFVPAQAYYDSASLNLDKKHPRFNQVNALKENLGAIVFNINIINTEDSLQALVRMPEKDRLKKIETYVDNLRKEDERRKEEEENPNALSATATGGVASVGGSNWAFDNPQIVSFGIKEFAKIWGSRKNEDNWRRKNKAMVMGDPGQTYIDPIAMENMLRDSLEKTRYNPQTYIDMLPFGDSALAASSAATYEALYNLGILYKQNLRAYDRAIESFEDLVRRNTQNKHFPETYYQLFVLNGLINNTAKTAEYKNIILQQYPESEYAQIINDPEYLKRKEQNEKGADVFYAETFNQYRAKNFTAVSDNYAAAQVRYKDSDVLPRFALLNALAKGYTQGRDEYIRELGLVDSLYQGTDQAKEARRIIDALNSIQNIPQGGDSLQAQMFVKGMNEPHFVIISVPDMAADLNSTKIALGNFNAQFFSTSTINIREILFDQERKFLEIKIFENGDKALTYATAMDRNSDVMEEVPTETIPTYFVISQKNYIALMGTKQLADYMKFYFDNYKPQ